MQDDSPQPFDHAAPEFDRSPLDVRGLLSRPIWKELRTFLAVAKSRSFAEAATMLNASGPTVSRDVKRLEEQTGANLVVASHSGITLTAMGRALALDLADLDFKLHSLSSTLQRERSSVAGRVSVSVTSGLAVAFVAPAVQRLSRSYPEIEVDLKGQISLVDFAKNQTDIMLSLTPIRRAGVTLREIGTLHLVPVAARSYVARQGVPTRSNLARHDFLQCSYYEGGTQAWKPWMDIATAGRIAHFAEDSLAYYGMVKTGAGIGLLGSYILIEPRLVPVDLGIHIPLPFYAAVATDRLRSAPVAAVFEWVVKLFTENPFFGRELRLQPGHSMPEEDFRAFFNVDGPQGA
ncbi:LysR family transcriptional regulator [Aureimonas populi]|uniref:LysR family transcriptional regulator n=2 Tax=Aureimonas populi TaxID=1701758 RepID=A0ABW5CMF9_9HYPH